MNEAAHVLVEFVCKRCQGLLLSWVGDGWDGALTMCKGDSVEVDFVMIEPGKKLGGKHCLGYVLGKNGEDFVSMAEVTEPVGRP